MVTFGRAGEDKKFSKLGDVEATLQGFAGADYDLQVHSLFCVYNMFQHILHVDSSLDLHIWCCCMQDALVGATDKQSGQHEKDGEVFYDYEVTGAVSQCQGLMSDLLMIVKHADKICTCRTCTTWHPSR